MSKRYNRTIAALAALAQEIEDVGEVMPAVDAVETAKAIRKIIEDSKESPDKYCVTEPDGNSDSKGQPNEDHVQTCDEPQH